MFYSFLSHTIHIKECIYNNFSHHPLSSLLYFPSIRMKSNKFPNEIVPSVSIVLLFPLFFPLLVSLLLFSSCLSPLSPSRRSCSIDKSPGSSNAASPISQRKDINRSESLRVVSNRTHRIFRPSDLIHGEVLGKGCFGQAIKVDEGVKETLTSYHSVFMLLYSWCPEDGSIEAFVDLTQIPIFTY